MEESKMSHDLLNIADVLKTIRLTDNNVKLKGELLTNHSFTYNNIFYAELFDGKTALRVAFHPQKVPIPENDDCIIEVEGNIQIYANKGSLTLWANHYDIIGDSELRNDIATAYKIIENTPIKRIIPTEIQKVTVISPKNDTSPALQDFMNALYRQYPGNILDITNRQVRMRGQGAADEIAAEIRNLTIRECDLYCIISGGGDKYGLDQVFAAQILVNTLCSTGIPAIVGIGHSKDHFPLHKVAYRYADTPTAAGTILGELASEITRKNARIAVRKKNIPPPLTVSAHRHIPHKQAEGTSEKQKNGCYIITATCGTDSQEVEMFYPYNVICKLSI